LEHKKGEKVIKTPFYAVFSPKIYSDKPHYIHCVWLRGFLNSFNQERVMKKTSLLAMVVCSLVCSIAFGAGGDMGAGTEPLTDGSADYPYAIEDMADFDEFTGNPYYWDDYIRLETNIDLGERTYSKAVIAPDEDNSTVGFQGTIFTGFFDGNGYVIRNLAIDTDGIGNDYLGLFGRIQGYNSKIKNLGVENVIITGNDSSYCLGGLCGYNDQGSIDYCFAISSIYGGWCIGGLCGSNYGNITNSHSISSVTGGWESSYLGGLCGHNAGEISDCYSMGMVFVDETFSTYLGGLCGSNSGMVANSYSDCTISNGTFQGSAWVGGGLCGLNSGEISNCHAGGDVAMCDSGGLCGTNLGNIKECYATGEVCGSGRVGGLCGHLGYGHEEGTIINCYATGEVCGSDRVGGLCGVVFNGSITNSFARSNVVGQYPSGGHYFGGLCGFNGEHNADSSINNCYAAGSVTAGDSLIGGLCGTNRGVVNNCYATGPVTVICNEGRGIGGLSGGNSGTITNSYAAGLITVGDDSLYPGGLCGVSDGTITNCFWDIETSGIGNENDDNYGAIGKTTVQMQTESTFIGAGWDFTDETVNGTNDIWRMCADGINYPRLAWDYFKTGDFACPDGVHTEDLDYYVGQWLMNNCTSANNYCGGVDLNYSGKVNLADWAIFAENWLLEI
jgi:hypothetical protein